MRLTRKQYQALWADPEYRLLVIDLGARLDSDGCTCASDLYLLGCYEHDIAYRTHCDPRGFSIDKDEADRRFRWFIQMKSPLRGLSPMSWWRWAAVSLFGGSAWSRNF